MAEIDILNARIQQDIEDIQDIKDKIEEVALNKSVSITYGTDTPLSVLTKINNGTVVTPSGALNITSNEDNVNVSSYASANVRVPTHEGEPIEISTSAGMDAVLVAANVGKVYRYVGTTDATYTNGGLYEVEEVVSP